MKAAVVLRILAFAVIAGALTARVTAQSLSFIFNNGSVSADGWITVTDGNATTGSISVSGSPLLSGTFSLVTPVPASHSVRDSLGGGGDDMIFDNLFQASETHLTSDGLGFAIGFDGNGRVAAFANLWENAPGNYSLYLAGDVGNGHSYEIYGGSASFVAVPENATVASLLGLSALAFVAWRRRLGVSVPAA